MYESLVILNGFESRFICKLTPVIRAFLEIRFWIRIRLFGITDSLVLTVLIHSGSGKKLGESLVTLHD